MCNVHIMYMLLYAARRNEINQSSDIVLQPQVFVFSVPYESLYTELQNEAHCMLRENVFPGWFLLASPL
jgi:hypothetical protein